MFYKMFVNWNLQVCTFLDGAYTSIENKDLTLSKVIIMLLEFMGQIFIAELGPVLINLTA